MLWLATRLGLGNTAPLLVLAMLPAAALLIR
jgi:hypothetical protein